MKHFIYIKENSQRVQRKNFQPVANLPLWKNLIYRLSGEDVYIDTDSEEILQECKNVDNITCYKRLDRHIELENSAEFGVSPALLMIDRFLDTYVEDENEVIVTPHVTSPFIKLQTIKSAAEKLDEGYDSVQACTIHQEFAYYKNQPINFEPSVVQKTQDLEPIKLGNGAFFIFTKKTFKENKNRVGKKPFLYPISTPQSIEIDTYEDLTLARMWAND
jgi:CMP-N-acetylneuraminic acid synthetase